VCQKQDAVDKRMCSWRRHCFSAITDIWLKPIGDQQSSFPVAVVLSVCQGSATDVGVSVSSIDMCTLTNYFLHHASNPWNCCLYHTIQCVALRYLVFSTIQKHKARITVLSLILPSPLYIVIYTVPMLIFGVLNIHYDDPA